MVRTVALGGFAALVIAADWLRFEEPRSGGGRPVALALLAGMTQRPSRLALGASALVIVGAFALSSSPAVAKTAFLDWQHWDFYTRPAKPVDVRYVWDAHYGGVHFPKRETTVLSI